ncbi:MAG: hypothetical protein QM778_23720 [Myxococcales bacterium]
MNITARAGWLLLWCNLVGCYQVDLYADPTPDAAAANNDAALPPVSPEHHGAGEDLDLDAGADADANSADRDGATPDAPVHDAAANWRHGACAQPLPDVLPKEPVLISSGATSSLNAWTSGKCSDSAPPVFCDSDIVCADGTPCFFTTQHGGICGESGYSSPNFVAFSYRDGACHRLVTPDYKKRACCAGIEGVDCRKFPAVDPGAPGELCTQHTDCETGLLCTARSDKAFAVCTCPGVREVEEPPLCERPWLGQEPTPPMEPGTCRPAMAAGYSVQALPRSAGSTILAANTGRSGEAILLTADAEGSIKRLSGIEGHFRIEDVTSFTGPVSADTAQGSDFYVHAVITGSAGLRYLYRPASNGTWQTQDLSAQVPGQVWRAKLLLGSDDKPIIVASYWDEQGNDLRACALASQGAHGSSGWQFVELARAIIEDSLDARIGSDGGLYVLHGRGQALRYAGDVVSTIASTPARNPRFVRGASALEWTGVTASAGVRFDRVIFDVLPASNKRQTLYTMQPTFEASAASAVRNSNGALFSAFLASYDAMRLGIVLHQGVGFGSSDTVLMNEPFEPWLVLDAADQPQVFYEAQGFDSAAPDGAFHDIRHVFPGDCPGIRNLSCGVDLTETPEPFPTPERPEFDLWRDVSCGQVATFPLCFAEHHDDAESCDVCWSVSRDQQGVCTPLVPLGGEGARYVSLKDGTMAAWLSDEARARGCCAGLSGFDCRAWPYAKDSARGEDCARNADCELGLVCKESSGQRGRCVCPDEEPEYVYATLVPQLAYEPGNCRAAEVPGFSYEVLSRDAGSGVYDAVLGDADSMHVLGRFGGSPAVTSWEGGAWRTQRFDNVIGVDGALAIDSKGRLHAAVTWWSTVTYLLRDEAGTWHTRVIIDRNKASVRPHYQRVRIVVRSDDTPVILVYAQQAPLSLVGLFGTDKPLEEAWGERNLLSLDNAITSFSASIDAQDTIRAFFQIWGSHVHYTVIPREGSALDSSWPGPDHAVGVSSAGGLTQWVASGFQDGKYTLSLRSLADSTQVRTLISSDSEIVDDPLALRRASGALALAYPRVASTVLYQESQAGVTTRELPFQAGEPAFLEDKHGTLHWFLGVNAGGRSLGLRHYFEGACPASEPR